MRLVCINLCIALFVAAAFSEGAEPVLHKFSNQAGIAVGYTGGAGLSYRKWYHDKYGIQMTGFFSSRKDEYRGTMTGYDKHWRANAGVLGLYNCYDWKFARALLYAGTSFYSESYRESERIMIDSVYYPYSEYSDLTGTWTIGSGIGFDVNWWRLGVSCMTGVRFGYSFSDAEIMLPDITFDCGIFFLF
jgi:hypothetical protein